MQHFIAFDLGASSGRTMLGTLADGKLALEELHRFPNEPVRIPQGLYWDTFRLWHEILQGAAVAGRGRKLKLDGVGLDTWGVDFGLFASDGSLVDNPRHYRDSRNHGMIARITETIPAAELYGYTGIQFMDLNTLPQLYAMKLAGSPALEIAEKLLFMPDIFNYWLTGVQKAELTIASTSQFYDPANRRWATELFDRLGLPARILPEIVPTGTRLGPIRPEVAEATGLAPETPVFASAGHDTAAAVAAVPAEGDGWCYISSGTWSLMGVELAEPVINEEARRAGLTNEVGYGGRIRFLKNIAGMWLIQECRRAWALEGREYSYAELAELAGKAPRFPAVIDPDRFPEPGSMPQRIAAYCRETGQKEPAAPGELCRTILESLALRYRQVLEALEGLLGKRLDVIHIVGGGSKNEVLNQLAADCTGRVVVAGPAEATAAGNALIQAIGAGALSGLEEARAVVQRSFPVKRYEPRETEGWDEAYAKFRELRGE